MELAWPSRMNTRLCDALCWISKWLMTLSLIRTQNQHTTVIRVVTHSPEAIGKDMKEFYAILKGEEGKVLIPLHVQSQSGKEYNPLMSWNKEGNFNQFFLLAICMEQEPVILNALLYQRHELKTSWTKSDTNSCCIASLFEQKTAKVHITCFVSRPDGLSLPDFMLSLN